MIALTGIPRLETERLVLRGPQPGDFEVFAEFAGSARAEHIGGAIEPPQAWRAFGHLVGHWALRGYGMFILTLDGHPIGMAGAWNPVGWPEPEIGWSIWDPAAEGKGFAREAALAARGWAYDALGWTTAISLIAPANDRSATLARRLGAMPEREAEVMGKTAIIWRHPAADTLPDGGMEAYA